MMSSLRGVIDAAALRVAAGKAGTLVEALPWLERFRGALVVVKYGGNAMIDDALKAAFAQDIAFLRYAGLRPVVVHGGGPQIGSMLTRLGLTSEFKGGLRVTTPEVMDVVRMVLTGQVRRELVGLLNHHGPLAVGLSGEDADLFGARRGAPSSTAKRSTSGWSGTSSGQSRRGAGHHRRGPDPRRVDGRARPRHPGQVLNVNADTAAAALAVALGARKLVVLTDVEGVYAAWPDRDSLLSQISLSEARRAARRRSTRAWCPSWRPASGPSKAGVPQAHVVDGRTPHSICSRSSPTPESARWCCPIRP
jgi:acetylglutamate kinase